MTSVNDSDFNQKVISAPGNTIVDFWQAIGGQPCLDSLQMLESIESEYPTVEFYSLNTALNPVTAGSQNITVLPTVIIYKDGMVHARLEGAQVTKANVRAALDGLPT